MSIITALRLLPNGRVAVSVLPQTLPLGRRIVARTGEELRFALHRAKAALMTVYRQAVAVPFIMEIIIPSCAPRIKVGKNKTKQILVNENTA